MDRPFVFDFDRLDAEQYLRKHSIEGEKCFLFRESSQMDCITLCILDPDTSKISHRLVGTSG